MSGPTNKYDGPLAQLAEQQTLNLRVLGSIPRRLTKFVPEFSLSYDSAELLFSVYSHSDSQSIRERHPTSLPLLSAGSGAHAYKLSSVIEICEWPNVSITMRG